MTSGNKVNNSFLKKRKKEDPENEEPIREEKEPVKSSRVAFFSVVLVVGLAIILVIAGWYLCFPWPRETKPGAPVVPAATTPASPEPATNTDPTEEGISLFVMGKSATGKSTLTGGLLGLSNEDTAKRGEAPSPTGIFVEEISSNGVRAKVFTWGSPEHEQPELEKNTEAQIREVNVALLTLRMDDTRIRPEDKSILRKLGQIFGTKMWEKTVITLTYANRVSYIQGGKEEKSKSHLEKKKAEWTAAVHRVLKEEKIPRDLMCSIPILPAGYYKKPEFYGESWRDFLVAGIVSRVNKNIQGTVKRALKLETDVKVSQNFCINKE